VSRPAVAIVRGTAAPASGWIANAGYDGWFFVGSIALCALLVAVAVTAPALAIPATIVAGVLFANTHNLVTGFFFLTRLTAQSSIQQVVANMILLGSGMGLTASILMIAITSSSLRIASSDARRRLFLAMAMFRILLKPQRQW